MPPAKTKKKPPLLNFKWRDSAFTLLFRDKKYVYDLYRALRPQNHDVRPQDIDISTLQLLWVRGYYLDLSFSVGKRLCVLTEAQTGWCPHMPARMLVYYSDLLKKYFAKQQIELTSGSLRRLPAPKFFVIYTGSGHDDVCEQHVTAAFGEEADLQGQVPIVRSGPPGSILEQYIAFCHLYQEQKKRFSQPKDIVQNTIKICVERGILVDFLTAHAAEVEEVMEQQFNQEQIFERIRQEDRQEGRQQGRQLGLEEGQEKTMVSNLHQLMRSMGWSAEQAMNALGIVDGNRQKYGKLLQSTH